MSVPWFYNSFELIYQKNERGEGAHYEPLLIRDEPLIFARTSAGSPPCSIQHYQLLDFMCNKLYLAWFSKIYIGRRLYQFKEGKKTISVFSFKGTVWITIKTSGEVVNTSQKKKHFFELSFTLAI